MHHILDVYSLRAVEMCTQASLFCVLLQSLIARGIPKSDLKNYFLAHTQTSISVQ